MIFNKKITIRFTKKYFYDLGEDAPKSKGLWAQTYNLRTGGKLILDEAEAYWWLLKYPEYFEITN